MRTRLSIVKYELPAGLWAIFICILCTSGQGAPGTTTLMGIPADKLGHAFIFSVLVFFMMLGALQYLRVSFPLLKTTVIIGAVALAYGIFIELVQHYAIPGRVGDVMDVLADMAGSAIGWCLFYIFRRQLK